MTDELPGRAPRPHPHPTSVDADDADGAGPVDPAALPSVDDVGLAAFLAGVATVEAAADRGRTRDLLVAASADGSLSGVLLDLAERGDRIVVTHRGGSRRGRVVGLGADFVAVADDGDRVGLVVLGAVESVTTLPGVGTVSGTRPAVTGRTLRGALELLAPQRTRLRCVTATGSVLAGEVRAMARDVLTLRRDGGGGTAYVSLDALAEVSTPESAG